MTQRFGVLIVDDEPDIIDVLELAIVQETGGEIRLALSGDEAIQILKSGFIPALVVSDLRMAKGSGADLYLYLKANLPDLVFVICSGSPRSDVESEVPGVEYIVEKPKVVEPIKELVRKLMKLKGFDLSRNEERYIPIRFETLIRLGFISCELYMKLSETKYVRISHSNADFDPDMARKYLAKKFLSFYLKAEDAPKFIDELEKNVSFSYKRDGLSVEEEYQLSSQALESIDSIARVFQWDKRIQAMAMNAISISMRALKKSPSLLSYLEKLQKNPDSYMASHSQCSAIMACAIADKKGWASDFTFAKLSLAALVHDLPLANMSREQVETLDGNANKQDSNLPDIVLYRMHSLAAETLLNEVGDSLPDVAPIIRQHHEIPDGTGFPAGLNGAQIAPLAAIFLVAHDFIHLTWDKKIDAITIAEFIRARRDRYNSGQFRKIISILENL